MAKRYVLVEIDERWASSVNTTAAGLVHARLQMGGVLPAAVRTADVTEWVKIADDDSLEVQPTDAHIFR